MTNATLMAAGYNTPAQVRRDAAKAGLQYPSEPESTPSGRKPGDCRKWMTDDERRHIARLYRDDVHLDAIAAITGRHQATIRRLLYKLGLKPKPDVGPNGGRPRLS